MRRGQRTFRPDILVLIVCELCVLFYRFPSLLKRKHDFERRQRVRMLGQTDGVEALKVSQFKQLRTVNA